MKLRSLIRPLDRYVFTDFWRIFIATAIGFPILIDIIDLTDNLDKYLGRNLSVGKIALSYVYWFPDSVFMVLPAAVLFATVFSIGAFTRHSEITAAKASGISFYRFIAPIFLGAFIATCAGLVLGEIAPRTNKLREQTLESRKKLIPNERYNFAYATDRGRTYKITMLNQSTKSITGVQIDRRGQWPTYPQYVLSSTGGQYRDGQGWLLAAGTLHLIVDDRQNLTFQFDSLSDHWFRERPIDLATASVAPADMGYRELGQFISAMERSGADVNQLRVERMLKIAIPVTCLVILLFGAPLATSTQRGGAAYGIGISLATTIIFLIMIQMTKAIGGKGVIPPELAAWLPSILFGTAGAVLFARVRT